MLVDVNLIFENDDQAKETYLNVLFEQIEHIEFLSLEKKLIYSNERGECVWEMTQNTWGTTHEIKTSDNLFEQTNLEF